MKKYSYWLLSLLLIGLAFYHNGCRKCCNLTYLHLPQTLYFKISQNGQIITDSSYLSKVRIYYYKNGCEIDNPNDIDNDNHVLYDETGLASITDSIGLFSSYFLPEISTENHQYFYFEFPDGTVDTLWLNAEKVIIDETINESCDCITPIRAIKFNGKIPDKNSDDYQYINYYIFNK